MAGGDNRADNGGDGIRRRHSSQYDVVDLVAPAPSETSTSPTAYNIEGPRRVMTDPNSVVESTSSAVDNSARRSLARPSIDAAPRVRFSTDVERPPSEPARTGSFGGFLDSTQDRKSSLSKRPGTPELFINTHERASHGGSTVLGQGTVGSPSSIVSSTSPRSASWTSPLSPTTRNRGYSLRRALFHRAAENQATSPGSVIELQEGAGSSSRVAPNYQADMTWSKKSGDTTIMISPADLEYPGLPERTTKAKGVKGTSALPNYETWIQKNVKQNGISHKVGAFADRARKFILRIHDIPPSKDGRHIDLDASRKKPLIDERTNKAYIGNTIRSSRYNAWNFLPRQLIAQFSKLANFYFLCVSILQMIPGLSTTGSYTTIAPLIFFVSISIAKEGYDDLRRYRLDKEENNRVAKVLHAYKPTTTAPSDEESAPSPTVGLLHWATTKWKDLRVGDVIHLNRNDPAPADLVLLYSSGENGIAYVETMALDGETNLKSKQTTASLAKVCKTPESVATCNAKFVVEDPSLDLYNFEGRVTVDGETSPLSNSEIIYRGSVLRNTPGAIGMVIYSGEECRIRMNANKNPRIKAPSLQSIVNRVVIVIVIFVLSLAIFNTVAYQIWAERIEEHSWYLNNAGVAFVPILASFFIMFNTMIPLSLYVSLEIIKLAQMFLLNDIDMYDEVSDTPFEARTSTINEELGQISYIFSDKTGTLTDNSMKFRKMSIAGTAWLHDADLEKEDSTRKLLLHKKRSKGKKPMRKSRDLQSMEESLTLKENVDRTSGIGRDSNEALESGGIQRHGSKWKSSARPAKSQPELLTVDMIRYIQRKPFTLFARKARLFLLSLALCHTCLPEIQKNGDIEFLTSSPDEHALVQAAKEMGFLVINRDVGTITLKIMPFGNDTEPTFETYEILDVIEFSSKRKRMSIVVRFPDQRICIFCKGADSIVMQRLKLATLANKKVVDIERRASKRKSLEAQYAMARKSEQLERKGSVVGRSSLTLSRAARPSFTLARTSTTLSRTSIGGVRRSSMHAQALQPVRDEIDQWLTERERDVEISSMEDNSAYYTSHPSTQLNRQSVALSEARSSLQVDFMDEFLDEGLVADEALVTERCFQHVNDFATEGLRTLLYGYRFLDEQEYMSWKKVFLDATTSLVDRQTLIEEAGELIEQNLELSGATAIEDKLQQGVPEAIDKLRRANIKMWMLTGDKRETAINIGQSCRLIKDYSTVTVLDHETGEVEQNIGQAVLDIDRGNVAHSVVVVDGQTLSMINEHEGIQVLFFELAVLADSVICCRASPAQKAALVNGIRKRVKKSITLAIGDGANDIAMIQEAHVGIGITGKEGLQAARTSDYSIAQFRFLTKLLLVHGRWNYIRTCKYTVGTFWKEMLFYLTQALYQRWAGYTGTSLYENWSLSMFNTLFTSLPVIFMGIFEKDLAASTLLAVPELYTKGQLNGGFNFRIYFGWMFMAASEAMVVYFIMLGLYGQAIFTNDQGLFAMGDLTFTACVIIISSKMQLIEMHNKSIVVCIALFCSIGGWFLWNILLDVLYKKNSPIYHVRDAFFSSFGRNALWWLTLILIVSSVIILELGVGSLRAAFFTSDVDTFQELERDPAIKRRFEEAASRELQMGWETGGEKVVEGGKEEEREGEVREILRNRPVELEEVKVDAAGNEVGGKRKGADMLELLSRRFGRVRPE
ncbi:phospholipid-translocating P-type ATPase [Lepidopterella palustris CBS 459.81]|uniref:Phospholipid-transporting ATPase n=1 Tax=Lepidopterella palustris CBS 459.81 TaxID=1314670 RepID=A0A8E2EAF3_9PEZI|nr:phospholipid-translocating P-type ATPase [Lepidopterella palustris CBS 459.81]